MSNITHSLAFIAGATIAGGGIGLAAVDDARAKQLDLAPTVETTAVHIELHQGQPVASISQRGVLTADALAAGAGAPSASLDRVPCAADVFDVVLAACPVDGGSVIETYKTRP